MIVRSMRLKNIKSYGEGPDGDGVTIYFEPGTNRIAGKNGHGKTTLVESLGYALFLSEPIFEESFQLETYFLRTGKKAAEIDVTFEHHQEFFRIERGLGPHSKRRTKVVQLEDGSICAEGEKEVSTFLCRLFDLPDPKRLSELFWKLIGVQQGRLTWPFDSKPTAAKDFFEPLLEVAVFRECFESLKPAVDEFSARLHDQERLRERVDERIRERADSGAALESRRQLVREIERRLQSLNETREEVSRKLAQLDALETSLRVAQSQWSAAQNDLALARQQREISGQRARECAEAVEAVAMVISGHRCFEEAENELQTLRAKLVEQRRLEMALADAEKKKIEIDGKAAAARSQMDVFVRQREQKETERDTLRERLEALRQRLLTSQPESEKQKDLASRTTHSLSDLRHFVGSYAASLAREGTTLERIKGISAELALRDVSVLETARQQEASATEALQAIRQQLAAANAEHSALVKQLQDIRDGICPFLKEQCRQFDPSKVEGDLREKGAMIKILQNKIGVAESALRAAQSEHEHQRNEEGSLVKKRGQLEQMVDELVCLFERLEWDKSAQSVNRLREWIRSLPPIPACANGPAEDLDASAFERRHRQNAEYLHELEKWWRKTENLGQEWINAVVEEERRRNADQRDEFNSADHFRRIESEIQQLVLDESVQGEVASACQRESAELQKIIVDLDQLRGGFSFVANEIALLEQTQYRYRSDYQRYLGAKPLADEQFSREIELNARREQEGRAEEKLRLCEITLTGLGREFDEAALASLRHDLGELRTGIAGEGANLQNSRREMDREEVRFREWQEACARRDQIDQAALRLREAVKLTELARVVLRDSAPMVAQQLCDRIAAQAQRIFNRINYDPVELRWEAVPRYSLRVIPGDRRFAMLSGGEQTKLALAMTLAMIQEFSGLRFCVFDEPTYGVDAESREKLGDAMLESQKAAELEQLILVSHDDAFDGKIERAVFLRKTAANGTEVAGPL
jgi:DNA repair protein SbcC/Rad50